MSELKSILEQAAFAAGIETARQMALITAMTIETRDGSEIVRDQAAVAALQGLAEGLKVAFLDPPPQADPLRSVFAAISVDGGDSGTVECPVCKGRLTWARDSFNDHPSRPVRDGRLSPLDAVGRSHNF